MGGLSFITVLVQASFRMATPLLLTAMGSILSERAGILNIGLEGMMLCGAFFAFATVYMGGSLWAGVASAALSGAILGLGFAYLTVTRLTNQTVTGAALNMFALGLTGFAYRSMVGVTGAAVKVDQFSALKIPLLSEIPVLGPALFQHNVLVYITFIIVPVVWYYLSKTSSGYELRAVGEHPRAADSLGIDVFLVRYKAVILSGILAGIGGSYLTLAHANTFIEGMSSGRGFIALAVVIFGKWNPFGAVLGALLFGAADALQLRLQALGFRIPYHFMLLLPYVLTMAVLAGAVGKAKPPASEGVPYER
jgi:ABC-type uncharacterized transport system permease subunit